MISPTTEDVGQFAGDVPLRGYNVQKHSVNAAILKMIPSDAVRSSIIHFGTRGLYGKVTRRTAQHDKDNKRRKDWRGAQALKTKRDPYPMRKPKPEPKHRPSGDREVPKGNARGWLVPGPPGREIVLDFRPRPLPSSSGIEAYSPPPRHSTRDIPPTADEGRLFQHKAMCPLPEAPSDLRLAGDTLPTSTRSSHHVPSHPSCFSGSSMAHPSYISPTNVAADRDPTISTSSPYDAHANQACASPSIIYIPPMSTSTGQTFVAQTYLTSLGGTHTFSAAIDNGDSPGASRRGTFAGHQMLLHFNYFAEPGMAQAWNPLRVTPEHYSNGNVNETAFSPYAAIPTLAHRDALPITHLNNGYAASIWGSANNKREGSATFGLPLTASYRPYPASWSHVAAFDVHHSSDGPQTHASAIQSGGLTNAIVNSYTGSRPAPPIDIAFAVPPANQVAYREPTYAPTTAPEVAWKKIPQPGLAPMARQNVNALTSGWSQDDANTTCLCAECVPREADYAQGFVGCFDACYPSLSPPNPYLNPDHANLTRGQWDDRPAFTQPTYPLGR